MYSSMSINTLHFQYFPPASSGATHLQCDWSKVANSMLAKATDTTIRRLSYQDSTSFPKTVLCEF